MRRLCHLERTAGRVGILGALQDRDCADGRGDEKLQNLRPVSFHLKTEPDGAVQYGLIAEEVDKIYPELVIRDAAGKVLGVRYDELGRLMQAALSDMREDKRVAMR